jgi:putative membrane protein
MFWHWGLFGHWLPFLGIFGFLFRIAFIAAIIAVVVVVLRRSRGRWGDGYSRGNFRGDSAAEILKQRYARGEISKDELEQKLKDIS